MSDITLRFTLSPVVAGVSIHSQPLDLSHSQELSVMRHTKKLPVEPCHFPVMLSGADVDALTEVYRLALAEETADDEPFPFVEPLTVRVSGGYVDLYRSGDVKDFDILCNVA